MLVTARTKDSEPGLPCEDSSRPLAYTSYPSSSGGARPDIRAGPAAGTPCDDPPNSSSQATCATPRSSRLGMGGHHESDVTRRRSEPRASPADSRGSHGRPRQIRAPDAHLRESPAGPGRHDLAAACAAACHAAPQAAQQAHEWPTSMPVGSSTKTRPRPTSAATVLLLEWGQRPRYSTEEKGRRSLSPTSCIYRLHLIVNLVRIVVLAEPKR